MRVLGSHIFLFICSGARLLLDGGSGGESSPVTATASGSASGTSGASVSAGAAIDGTTKTGVAGALAKVTGGSAAAVGIETVGVC